jgi:phosphatidylserine/phosphatidylglycerophosphate/cardiolipin synthase-like enzyme
MRRLIVCLLSVALALPAQAQPSPSFSVAFSPHRGATQAIVKLISEARQSIRLAAYSFTSKDISAALVQAHKG